MERNSTTCWASTCSEHSSSSSRRACPSASSGSTWSASCWPWDKTPRSCEPPTPTRCGSFPPYYWTQSSCLSSNSSRRSERCSSCWSPPSSPCVSMCPCVGSSLTSWTWASKVRLTPSTSRCSSKSAASAPLSDSPQGSARPSSPSPVKLFKILGNSSASPSRPPSWYGTIHSSRFLSTVHVPSPLHARLSSADGS